MTSEPETVIGVLDYGVGNVASMLSMFRRIGVSAARVSQPDQVADASALVLPGVGAFDDVVTRFRASGLIDPLRERVIEDDVRLLGICVGMQMLLESSEEGVEPGLGWVPGRVTALASRVDPALRLPAMGWFYVDQVRCGVLPEMDERQRYYFVHSYAVECDDPDDVVATVDYGSPVTAALRRGTILGTQFHPEKSHRFGVSLLSAFAAEATGTTQPGSVGG